MFPQDQEHKREQIFTRLLKEEAKQFCLNTALHGYRFIALPRRIMLERIVWAVICFSSLIAALTLLFITWFSFRKNPTVLLTDSNHHPIWQYPFPAVTVCEYNKISRRRAYDLANNLTTKDKVEKLASELKMLTQLLFLSNSDTPGKEFKRLQKLLDQKQLSVDMVLQKLATSCDDMLVRCLWKGEEKRCESIFEQIKTSEGYCCAFNYFALKKHTFSGASAIKAPKTPRRVSACGYQTGLEVVVKNDPEDYFASYIPSIGQKIIIHNPYCYPDWNMQSTMNSQKIVNLISVNPTITYSSNDIEKMSVTMRNCIFPNERELLYFSQYNFHNCMAECRMNLTMKLCGCVPFIYIDKEVKNRRKICNLLDIPCLKANIDAITSSLPGLYSSWNEIPNNEEDSEQSECKCLPDCENTEYVAESSSGALSREFHTNKPTIYGGMKLRNHSVFRVFYNDLVGIKNRRDVRFNWQTLLAYYGGLLGLFLGFSFVSGVEIIYFFSIRLIANTTKENKNKRNAARRVQNNLDPNIPTIHSDPIGGRIRSQPNFI